jgi:hypothetical protein
MTPVDKFFAFAGRSVAIWAAESPFSGAAQLVRMLTAVDVCDMADAEVSDDVNRGIANAEYVMFF